MNISRRNLLQSVGGAAASISLPRIARSQSWPDRPIRLIASSTTGSATDLVSRLIADGLTRLLGQTVIVEARPGAAGMVAAAEAARAKGDGYTFVSIFGSYAANRTLAPTRPYKESDLTGVTIYGVYPSILVGHKSLPDSLGAIVELAKAKPEELSFATGGAGTLSHIIMEQWANSAGIKLLHVPYKGGAAAAPDLISGRVGMMTETISLLKPMMIQGQVNGLAISAPKRHSAVPSVPTFAELGYPASANLTWMGMATPSSTPQHIVQRMSEAVVKVLQNANVRSVLAGDAYAMEIVGSNPEDTDRFIEAEMKKYEDIITRLKITAS